MQSRTRDRLILAACGVVVGTLIATGPPAVLAAMGSTDGPAGTSSAPVTVPDFPPVVPAPVTGTPDPGDPPAGTAGDPAADSAADARASADRADAAAGRAEASAEEARRAASDARAAAAPASAPTVNGSPSDGSGQGGTTAGGTTTPVTGTPGVPGTGSAAQALGWGAPTRVEEFNGTAPGPGWSLYDGPGHAGKGRRTPSAATVAGGALTISGDSSGNTEGMAWNPGSKYGRWEARMRAPVSDPTYHAVLLLWPDAENFPVGGEIDFMETGDATRQSTDFFLHYGASNSQIHGSVDMDLTQWHDWAVEWAPDHVTAFVDGKPWFRTDNVSILPPGPMHMTIQLDWFPQGGGSVTPSSMQVDWVRFYPITGTGTSPAPLDAVAGPAPVAAGALASDTATGGSGTGTTGPTATDIPPDVTSRGVAPDPGTSPTTAVPITPTVPVPTTTAPTTVPPSDTTTVPPTPPAAVADPLLATPAPASAPATAASPDPGAGGSGY